MLPSARTSPVRNIAPPGQPSVRIPPGQTARGQSGTPQHQPNQGPGRPTHNLTNTRQPQTPVQHQHQTRPDQSRGRNIPPPVDNGAAPRSNGPQQQNHAQSNQNQSFRPTPPGQQPPNQQRPGAPPQGNTTPSSNAAPPPHGRPLVGFVTSRAADLLQKEDSVPPLNQLPAFNPHAESPIPKEQRTPGVDHARSVPIKREAVGAPPAPQPPPQAATRPAAQAGASFGRSTNFVNPHQDTNRRIGMPSAPHYAMSPSANRGAYKPPTFANGGAPPNGLKRDRPALQDVSNTGGAGPGGANAEGPDVKRQRVEAPGIENASVTNA